MPMPSAKRKYPWPIDNDLEYIEQKAHSWKDQNQTAGLSEERKALIRQLADKMEHDSSREMINKRELRRRLDV